MSSYQENHYSLTEDWLKVKSKFSKWKLFCDTKGRNHLYINFLSVVSLHWFSYLRYDEIKSRIDDLIQSRNKFFIYISVLKLYSIKYVNEESANLKLIRNCRNYKTFLIPSHASLRSKTQNFLINLETWDEESLSRNWKRNLRRSKRSLDSYYYEEIDLDNYINSAYEIIKENSKLKKYNFPYTKNFLKNFIKVSKNKVFSVGAFNKKTRKLVAFRAFYIVNDNAIDFLAASSKETLTKYITYFIAFDLISISKKIGLKIYNLGGVDFKNNKGVYNFKKGLGGELVEDSQIYLALTFIKYLPDIIAKSLVKIISYFL